MKKVIGTILVVLAILRIVTLTVLPQPGDSATHRIQDWALVGVILAIGVAMSAPKKPQDPDDKK